MKALTIKQPWAWLIAHGYKNVENRTWRTNYRGNLLIHVSKSCSDLEPEIFITVAKILKKLGHKNTANFFSWYKTSINDISDREAFLRFLKNQRGKVIAQTNLVDVNQIDKEQNPWAISGQYQFVLENAIPLENPFAIRGKLGIWDVVETSQPEHQQLSLGNKHKQTANLCHTL